MLYVPTIKSPHPVYESDDGIPLDWMHHGHLPQLRLRGQSSM